MAASSTPERGWGGGRGLPPVSPVSSSRVGQRVRRLGTADQLGVVRFVGEVEGRTGTWLGVEWDEHGKGDFDGELNGRRYFVCSQRGQKAGNAASLVRESELFTSENKTRAENTPLVLRPGEDVYDWSVRPRDSMTFDFLMLMRNFSCCGARCILPEDDDLEPSASSAALSKMLGSDMGRSRAGGTALRDMTPPQFRRISADPADDES